MKLLLQLITLYLPGTSLLQIMMITAAVILFFKTTANKLSGIRKGWILKRRTRQMEKNMWAIE